MSDLVVVTLGTGIGAGVVLGGRLVRGANGFAGEPGHAVVDPAGPPCPCGQRGCWERFASGSGLAMLAQQAVRRGKLGAATFADRSAPTGEELAAAARHGDPDAIVVFEDFAGWVALGLAMLVNVLDPELVVIGGGLAAAADLYLDGVRDRLVANPTVGHRGVTVEVVPWGERASAVGAALLANRL